MWNLKSKANKQNRNGLIDTQNRLIVASGEAVWKAGRKRGGMKKDILVVSKQQWGCKVQQREHGQ